MARLVAVPQSGLDRLGVLLGRFLSRDVRGRLVIVGSAPGTGKSALIKELLDTTRQREPASPQPEPKGQLLLVPLHGPTLFGVGGVARAEAALHRDDAVAEKGAPADASRETGGSLAILQELVKALHFAVVRAVVERLRMRDPELAELLRVDLLRGDADLERLQAIWEGARSLESGLLGPAGPGQGWREITALWNLNRAFMVISGVAQRRRAAARRWTSEQATKMSLQTDWGKLATPALSLAAGVATGAALFPDKPVLTAFLALAGAMGGGFSWSTKRRRQRRAERAEEFTEKLDEQALFRWMPELVQQMKDIGLFPVIVVDEIRLAEWRPADQAFLEQLDVCRGIVNLGAFICLLLDRTSYRTLGAQSPDTRRRLDTAITDRIFISYRPIDLVQPVKRSGDADDTPARRRVFHARARPLALVLEPWIGRIDADLADDYQAALDAVLDEEPRVQASPEDRAFALDLLYDPARGLDAGERVFDNSRRGITRWAQERGWIRSGDSAPPWLHHLRRLWLTKMDTWVENAGAFARWKAPAAGAEGSGWFITEVEGEAFVRDVAETLSALAGIPLEEMLPPGGPADGRDLRLADRVARNAGRLQELLTAGLMLAWLTEGGGLKPTRVQAGAERWRDVAGSGVDGLTELHGLCGLGEAALDPWPLEAGKWGAAARGLLYTLQELDGVREERRSAAIERGRAAWRERLRRIAEGKSVLERDRRFVVWPHLSRELELLASYRLERRRAADWSNLALVTASELAWARDIALGALGLLAGAPGAPRHTRTVLVIVPDTVPDPDWELPRPGDGLATLISHRQQVWLDVEFAFTDILWFVIPHDPPGEDRVTSGSSRTVRDLLNAKPTLPSRCALTLVGTPGAEDGAFLEKATDAPCVPPHGTLVATLAAADTAWATRGLPASPR